MIYPTSDHILGDEVHLGEMLKLPMRLMTTTKKNGRRDDIGRTSAFKCSSYNGNRHIEP